MSESERGRGKKRKVHKTNLLEISFMIFFSTCLFAYIYMHIIYTSESPHCTSSRAQVRESKQASEQYAKGIRGILYFHIYWSNCISCFKALETLYHACEEERERERAHRECRGMSTLQMLCKCNVIGSIGCVPVGAFTFRDYNFSRVTLVVSSIKDIIDYYACKTRNRQFHFISFGFFKAVSRAIQH